MKTDNRLMSEYRDMVEKVSALYGEKSKDCINNYIDLTLVGEVRKRKVISALLLFYFLGGNSYSDCDSTLYFRLSA